MSATFEATEALTAARINAADIVTLVVYFVLVMGIGIVSMFGVKTDTEEGYFLAGRFMTWLPVGASLFATNIGSEHYVGLSGSGAEAGLGVGAFELNALFLLPVLAWVFIPVYMASGVGTLPEYMRKRFGGERIRVVISVISLLMYIFTKNSVDMYSGALFIQQAVGWKIYVSVFLLLGMTVLSTLTGGLAAVIYTDTLQCFIMIFGGLVLMVLGIIEVGGFEALYYKYQRAVSQETMQKILVNGTEPRCGLPEKDAWVMLRDPLDDEMPWAGFLFGQTTSSLWYWCADQMMVQRVLAAKTLSHAQGGCIFCGVIKLVPLFAMVLPGMIARVLYPDIVACASAESCNALCESEYSCSNLAYPNLVLGLMPGGMRGFMIAVMLSATMSDLSSTFNSASTLFTMDIYKNLRKNASITELMIVGRLAVVAVVVVGLGTIPLVQSAQGDQLFTYIQEITNCLSPPIAAVYLIGVTWKRGNEQGAFISLISGFVVGISRMGLKFAYADPTCRDEDNRPAILKDFTYMYFALFSFWFTVIVNVIVTLATAAPEPDTIVRTTFWTRFQRKERADDIEPVDEYSLKEYHEALRLQKEGHKGEKPPTPWSRRIFNFVCGAEEEGSLKPVLSVTEQRQNLQRLCDIRQKPRDALLLAIGAVFLIFCSIFLMAFFSVEWDDPKQPIYFTDDLPLEEFMSA